MTYLGLTNFLNVEEKMSSFYTTGVSWKAGSKWIIELCKILPNTVSDSFPRVSASKSKDNYKGGWTYEKFVWKEYTSHKKLKFYQFC